jgi:DNA-binding Lrp family transcriptional regulator
MTPANLTENRRLEPSRVKARYLGILQELSIRLSETPPKAMKYSDLCNSNKLSESRVCEVLKELEDGGYIKKIEVEGQPYYTLWKWGIMLLESEHSYALMTVLEMAYDIEVR